MNDNEQLAEEPRGEAPTDEPTTTDATANDEPAAATATPAQTTEEEWPTHGGYLGCLLAVMFGCLLAGFFASPLVQGAYRSGHGAGVGYGPVLNIVAIGIMVVGFILFGRIGWFIGKRVYREYPAPPREHQTTPTEQTEPPQRIGEEQQA